MGLGRKRNIRWEKTGAQMQSEDSGTGSPFLSEVLVEVKDLSSG